SGNVLVVDDEESMRIACEQALTEAGYRAISVANGTDALNVYDKESFDVVLLDLKMPGVPGMEVLKRLRTSGDKVSVIVITAFGTIETAVEAMKAGAADFLTKPFSPEALVAAVDAIVEWKRTTFNDLCMRSEAEDHLIGNMLMGRSDAMRQLTVMIRKVAPMDSTVLITGETGCGKELVARTIHRLSVRSTQPFVTVDCGALVESLFESEMFGHIKGAFTGATDTKQGKFQMADGGTLFLDEVANISIAMQARLLRVIQEREVAKVGSNNWEKVNTRIIAATNRNLSAAIERGEFREDLFYRLNVFHIEVTPLSQRIEDIPSLADYFVRSICEEKGMPLLKISRETAHCLMKHDWPGNVRELRNVIERAIVVCEDDVIRPVDLSRTVLKNYDTTAMPSGGSLADVERNQIVAALKRFNGHRNKVAEYLGINRKTLREKIRKYSLEQQGTG
ncbi:MAG: sigma-54-dependent Fis family transcriptional regulator, partial [Chitinivibrionales bacterium]|nr:sigma-54-dependent Fis family transcriptional regulator [Chitinivibrionales bacterium]